MRFMSRGHIFHRVCPTINVSQIQTDPSIIDRRVYNQILRCATDPLYTLESEDLAMLYRPLFWTSYWCEDWLACSNYRGGCSYILVSSASSKTAFCFAYRARKRAESGESGALSNVKIIGLTSKSNLTFTTGLGLYDEVYEYDTFLNASPFHTVVEKRWVYVDVAGNKRLNDRIYAHFASPYTSQLVASISLGMTNLSPASGEASAIEWSTDTGTNTAPSTSSHNALGETTSAFWPKSEQFFTPEWVEVRRHQLSLAEMFQMQKRVWGELMEDCTRWVRLEHVYGGENVRKAYERIVREGMSPDKGMIWSLWPEEAGKDGLKAKL